MGILRCQNHLQVEDLPRPRPQSCIVEISNGNNVLLIKPIMATFMANKSGCGIFAPTAGCNQENKSTIALARPNVPLPLPVRKQKTNYLEHLRPPCWVRGWMCSLQFFQGSWTWHFIFQILNLCLGSFKEDLWLVKNSQWVRHKFGLACCFGRLPYWSVTSQSLTHCIQLLPVLHLSNVQFAKTPSTLLYSTLHSGLHVLL